MDMHVSVKMGTFEKWISPWHGHLYMMDTSLRGASLLDGYIAKSENDSKMDIFIKH